MGRLVFACSVPLLVIAVACSTLNSTRSASPASDGSTQRDPASAVEGASCSFSLNKNRSSRCDLQVSTTRGIKTVSVVKLAGSPEQTAYDNGYLMARELEDGVLKTSIDISTANLKGGSVVKAAALTPLYTCYLNRMKRSVSREFLNTTSAMHKGYADRMRELGLKPKYTADQALEAILGIEVANVAEGLARRLSQNPLVIGEVAAACGLTAPLNLIRDSLEELANQPKLGGCIGFSIPKSLAGGQMIHARNLDIDMVDGWNKHPTFYLVAHDGRAKFVASTGAGMIVPGGVGGMNEYGLAISLHQMSTTKYNSEIADRKGLIAPSLSQKILENAKTIEEALRIVENSGNFASWTLFVSETKTGRVGAIEFSGEKVRPVYIATDKAMGQTNHFLHPEMQNQAFTYNFNKLFESKSRLKYIEEEMQTLTSDHPADVQWAVTRLAGHRESVPDKAFPYSAKRAFGRTAVKAYNVMSVVMVPERNEYWSTVAERNPAAHSTYIGYQVDWDSMTARPLGTARTTEYDALPNWDKSLETYVAARQAYVSYLENDPAKSETLLSQAIKQASADGVDELPYLFMRARVRHELGMAAKRDEDRTRLLTSALEDWNHLWERRHQLYIYGQALVAMYSVATMDELDPNTVNYASMTSGDRYYIRQSPERKSRIEFASQTLKSLAGRYSHFDLDAKRDVASALARPQRGVILPSLDFVVVEQ